LGKGLLEAATEGLLETRASAKGVKLELEVAATGLIEAAEALD
jgi:hypothetical protein